MIKTALACLESGEPIHAMSMPVNGDEFHFLVTTTIAESHGAFKAATRTSAGTTIVTSPSNGGSIVLTDLLISADKVNGALVTVQFTDGVETIVIFNADVTDAPFNTAIAFKGQWRGWKNARLELVTTGVVNSTASVGYYKIKAGLDFSEWDALR